MVKYCNTYANKISLPLREFYSSQTNIGKKGGPLALALRDLVIVTYLNSSAF